MEGGGGELGGDSEEAVGEGSARRVGTWSLRNCCSWPRRSLALFCRPRRCSCICRRLTDVGFSAGAPPAEGAGGPDTGVAPLLRLPDPHAAERGIEGGRSETNSEKGQGSSPHVLTAPYKPEALGCDSVG